uniref:flagellar hook-length control protein FliK n=1 Tax=Cellulosimicrobium cellulans TaxID=1710 RepID=UPI000B0FD0CE
GKIHFWLLFIGFHTTFLIHHWLGVEGAATAPASPPPAAPTLHAQVSGPVFQLLDAGDGDHVLTLSVTPEHLGPVTVRAHITGGELRIELFSPHDTGREALRALVADLRVAADAAGLPARRR